MSFSSIISTGNVSLIDQVIVESVRDIYMYESEEVCKAFDTYIKILESKDYEPEDDFENSIFEIMSDYIDNNSMLFEATQDDGYNIFGKKAQKIKEGNYKKADPWGLPNFKKKRVERKHYEDYTRENSVGPYHNTKNISWANAYENRNKDFREDTRPKSQYNNEYDKVRDATEKQASDARSRVRKNGMKQNYNNTLSKYKNKSNFSKLLRRGKAMAQTALSKPTLAAKAIGYGIASKFSNKFQKKANAYKSNFNYEKQKKLI